MNKWLFVPSAFAGIVVALGAGCGSSDKDVNVTLVFPDGGSSTVTDGGSPVPTSTENVPAGTVSGILYDGTSAMPLTGAAITVAVGGKTYTGMSDANGFYVIANVPATTAWLTASKDGYAPAYFSVSPSTSVFTATGTVVNPITQVNPFGLLKTSGNFVLRLVTEDGQPAAGVVARAKQTFRYVTYQSGYPQTTGYYDVTATSDATGYVSFTNLIDPTTFNNTSSGGTFSVDIAPATVGSPATYSFLGLSGLSYNLLQISGTNATGGAPTISLAGPNTGVSIIESNIDYATTTSPFASFTAASVNPVSTGEPLTFVFNQSMNAATLRADLYNEDGTSSTITLAPTLTVNALSLTPSTALTPGARYNLALQIEPTVRPDSQSAGTRRYDNLIPVFAAPAGGSNVSLTVANDATGLDRDILTFSEPVGIGQGASSTLSCTVFYETNLDGDTTITSPGEYSTTQPLVCSTGFVAFDATAMVETEPTVTGKTLRTGFSTKWTVTYDNGAGGACKVGVAQPPCVKPASGTVAHLVFSQLGVANTVTRANGDPLPDTLSFTIP